MPTAGAAVIILEDKIIAAIETETLHMIKLIVLVRMIFMPTILAASGLVPIRIKFLPKVVFLNNNSYKTAMIDKEVTI